MLIHVFMIFGAMMIDSFTWPVVYFGAWTWVQYNKINQAVFRKTSGGIQC